MNPKFTTIHNHTNCGSHPEPRHLHLHHTIKPLEKTGKETDDDIQQWIPLNTTYGKEPNYHNGKISKPAPAKGTPSTPYINK